MSDPIYADARLAVVYDSFDAHREDLDAYVDLAHELGAQRVVDLGCGTGCLALRLVAPGRTVTGVDPARASLDVARSKVNAEQVVWLEGDGTAIPSDADADLVVMTGNAAQAVLTEDAWDATLRNVHAALRLGGHFVFESRRPERRGWEEWIDPPPVTVDVPDIGPVERSLELTEVGLPLVSFRFTYRFLADSTTLVSDSTICFRGRDDLVASLRAGGFRVRDIRDAPDRPGQEFVLVSCRD